MRHWTRRRCLAGALGLLFLAPAVLAAEPKAVRIATVTDGDGEAYQHLLSEIRAELAQLLGDEFKLSFPPKAQLVADWSMASVARALDRALAAPGIDLVITVGLSASDEACRRPALVRPVVAAGVLDAQIQKLPLVDGRSGRKNLNYLVSPWELERDLKVFRDIVPFENLAFLVDAALLERIESEGNLAQAQAYVKKFVANYSVVPVGAQAAPVLAAILPKVDAVMLLPLPRLDRAQFDHLVTGLIGRRLASFSSTGRVHVERGILAGLQPAEMQSRRARQVAINVHRILLGEEAGQIPVAFSPGSRLVINVKTSRAIGSSPPYRVLMEAELLADEAAVGARKLSHEQVVQEALAANLDLALAHHQVLVGAAEHDIARSNLMPTLSLGSQLAVIDSDRAAASMGSQPELAWTASATLRQTLAEGALAQLAVEHRRQAARELKQEEVRLDIVEAALVAYMHVQQATVAERIRKNNVRLSRSNLELAHKRLAIGVSRSTDVYRWESVIARQRQEVIEAHLQQSLAELELNRLLRRPLREEFILAEIDHKRSPFTGGEQRLAALVDNPRSMQRFREFMVQEALVHAPELKQQTQNDAALARSQASVRRSFWLPAMQLSGQIDQRLTEAGAGTGGAAFPPEMAGLFPAANDTNWQLGLALVWPFFEGGLQAARLDQLGAERARLQTQVENLKQRVEQRVRVALQRTRASRASVGLARTAAEASRKNLDLVTDAYARGVLSILELLDAQNASVAADLSVVNADFAFMIDLIRSQRAAGTFFVLMNEEQLQAWEQRLARSMAKPDPRPPPRP